MSRTRPPSPKASPGLGVGCLHGGDRLAEGRARRVGVEEVGGAGVGCAEGRAGCADQGRRARARDRGAELAAAAVGLDERREQHARWCREQERRAGAGPAVSSSGDRSGRSGRPTRPPSRSRSTGRVRVDDRRDLRTGRAVEQVDAAGAGARGVVERRPDDQVDRPCPRRPRRTRAPAWASGLAMSRSRLPNVGCVGSPWKTSTSPVPPSLPGRSDHDVRAGRADRGTELRLMRGVGVGKGEGRQQGAEGRAVGVGVEQVRRAVARPGERAARRPDQQVVADRRDRRAEFVAGRGVRVGEDVNERAVDVTSSRRRRRSGTPS